MTTPVQVRAKALLLQRQRNRVGGKVLSRYSKFKHTYWNDPVGFVNDCIIWDNDGDGATEYQKLILSQLMKERRIAVRGPRGLGKTAFVSWIILWFALTRDGKDWKAIATAGSWRQLTKFLFPEIHKWARRLRWGKIGRAPFRPKVELMDLSLRLYTGEAMAIASNNPDLVEGAHADHLLYVFDEAKSISDSVFVASEGTFANANIGDREAFIVAASTPGEPFGWFYDIHSKKPGFDDWKPIHVTLEQTIQANRISPAWAEARKSQWGTDSPMYRNYVLGEFSTTTADGIIPVSWIEMARERWEEWRDNGFGGTVTSIGVDVGSGKDSSDKTIAAVVSDYVKVRELVEFRSNDPRTSLMEITGKIVNLSRLYQPGYIIVDTIGIGAGVVHRLRELGFPVDGFIANSGTELTDKSGLVRFANWRAAAWWLFREMLEPDGKFGVCLPPDTDETDLIGDLTAPTYKVMSNGKILVESKESVRKRLGRSTDYADAVIMAIVGIALLQEAQESETEYSMDVNKKPLGGY